MKRIILRRVGSIDVNNNSHHVNLHKGLNVITGDRETGKTTILHIIDYCFGKSSNDSIAKTITKITKWHFIVCELGDVFFLLARHATSSTKYILSNIKENEINYYDVILNSKVLNWNTINSLLFEKHGIEVGTLFDYASKKEKRITYRNCLSLCVQQDEDICSKSILFYRMNNENKKRSLNAELPLLCGMIDFSFYKKYDELLAYKKEIDKLKNRINDYNEEEELAKIKNLIKTLFIETNNTIDVDTIDSKEAFTSLKKNLNDFDPYDSKAIESVKELKFKLNEYEKYMSELNFKLKQLELQYISFNNLSNKLSESQEKSMIIDDIIEELDLNESVHNVFNELRQVLNKELSKVNINKNNNLELEKMKLQKEYKIFEQKRKDTLIIYDSLMIQYSENSNYIDKIKNLYKLESRIEEGFDAYSNYLKTMKDSLRECESKVNELEPKLKLQRDTLDKNKKQFEDNVSSYVNDDIKGFYPEFEHKPKKIGFDLNKLSCFYEINEEKVYLPGWGSDNNVLFAHIASTLAFQRTLANYETCIPSFIIYDQISRPYFPDSIDINKSKDMISLKQIFDVILRVIKEIESNTNNSLQVIVIEHANEGMSKAYLDSKIKDNDGNPITFINGTKYIDETKIKTNVFDDEKKTIANISTEK